MAERTKEREMLNIRDQFAMSEINRLRQEEPDASSDEVAKLAYEFADIMIKTRKQQ